MKSDSGRSFESLPSAARMPSGSASTSVMQKISSVTSEPSSMSTTVSMSLSISLPDSFLIRAGGTQAPSFSTAKY